jgi:hypothetical protein
MKPITTTAGAILIVALAACDGIPSDDGTGGTGGGSNVTTEPLHIEVPSMGRVYIDLDTRKSVKEADAWDLAFEGFDIRTNGGVSGDQQGAAFGPVAAEEFLAEVEPHVPFFIDDRTGGAFLDWYDYDQAEHVIYSRYHVYGVKRADIHYKLQVLTFYGEVAGAPTSGIYSIRWAEASAAGGDPITSLMDIDGTAGGPSPLPTAKSACIALATGDLRQLSPKEAEADSDWDLCFRRDSVSVNGGVGGPGGVSAVNLQASAIATEQIEDVKVRTSSAELSKLEDTTLADLSAASLDYRGDGLITAFTDFWVDTTSSPPKPSDAVWVVRATDGTSRFVVAFDSFEGATATSPGTIHARVRALQ